MSILPIYLYGTEVLRKKAKAIPRLDHSIIKLMYDLAETMHKANGIGLAATQVGELRRMLVVDLAAIERGVTEEGEEKEPPPGTEAKVLVMINPEIVEAEGSASMEEGCLSIPDLRAEVDRPQKVSVRYRDANFDEVKLTAEGILARVIQHEADHLDGIMFVDRVGKTRRVLLKSDLKKIEKGEVDTSYPSISSVEV
ncbi:MAG: def [Bacteroidetes bacterium]|nr:def [Bacteroidota bacterium]MDP2885432.1 peptide deformylase [Ignavibacteria bacterium]